MIRLWIMGLAVEGEGWRVGRGCDVRRLCFDVCHRFEQVGVLVWIFYKHALDLLDLLNPFLTYIYFYKCTGMIRMKVEKKLTKPILKFCL